MTKCKQSLIAAVMSTICAAVWLANCIIDVMIGLTVYGASPMSIILTVVWSVCAACWWLRWRQERRAVG